MAPRNKNIAPTPPADPDPPVVENDKLALAEDFAPSELGAEQPAGTPPPKFFTVLEHITPASYDRPGATLQYVADQFYPADDFLCGLWAKGDKAVTAYSGDA